MSLSGENTSSQVDSSEASRQETSGGSPPASESGLGSLASEVSLFVPDPPPGQRKRPPILVARTGGERKSNRRQGRRITWNLTPDFEPTATESLGHRRSFPAIACLAVSVAISTCLLVLGSFSLLDTYRYLLTTVDTRTPEYKVIARSVDFRPGAVSNVTPRVTKSTTTTSRKTRRAAWLNTQKSYHSDFCLLNVSSWSLWPAKHTKESVLSDLEEYCVIFVYCDDKRFERAPSAGPRGWQTTGDR
ncbi:hypothetical protein HPB50_025833 [Hyalomma asiaticum]|uniref:Uncharacterized protein n=1 Tax=Hyalomma asiaticum TaxID=266040 RepID=A0ACB7SPR1_HYAAI|nr:hypothetical protein HPB50_025833 [Hyalomma asiaticum]